jgi:CheY-like chemotaxis protein
MLVVDDLEEVRDILELMIESTFEHEILMAESGNQAIEILKNNKDIDIIISDYRMHNGTGGDLFAYVKENRPTPFILVTGYSVVEDHIFDGFLEDPKNGHLGKPFGHEELIQLINSTMSEVQEAGPLKEDSVDVNRDFCKIRISRAYDFQEVIGDTYIKKAEGKFVKIFNKGDSLETKRIDSYLEKGVEFLYIEEKEFNKFVNQRVKDLINRLGNFEADTKDLIGLHLKSIEQVQDLVRSIGVGEAVIELTEKITASVTHAIQKEKGLKKFLKEIIDKSDYQFELSNISNYLCCAMVKELNWDTKRQTEKFIYASMLCDIFLDESELASIIDIDDQSLSTLKSVEKEKVKDHIKSAVQVVSQLSTGNSDIEKMIRCHHEGPQGNGYPKGLNAHQIGPTEAVFILALRYGHELISQGKREDLGQLKILEGFNPAYQQGNFAKPYTALRNILEK